MKRRLVVFPLVIMMMTMLFGAMSVYAVDYQYIDNVTVNIADPYDGETALEFFNNVSLEGDHVSKLSYVGGVGGSSFVSEASNPTIGLGSTSTLKEGTTYELHLFVQSTQISTYRFNCNSTDYNYLGEVNVSSKYRFISAKEPLSAVPDPNSEFICIVIQFTVGGTSPAPSPEPAPAHTHNYTWMTIYDATEYSDGLEGEVCTICGASKNTSIIPAANVLMANRYKQIINAKDGDTVVLEMGLWHSLPNGFMQEIANRRKVTFIIHSTYEHKNYEIVIPAGKPVVIDPSIPWYGIMKQNEMFGMKEI